MTVVLMVVAVVVAGMAFADPPEGMKWETEAIQAQIDAAAAKGGGRVIVPKGIHPCQTLYLKSGVELHLEKGAVILGGTKPEGFRAICPQGKALRICFQESATWDFSRKTRRSWP